MDATELGPRAHDLTDVDNVTPEPQRDGNLQQRGNDNVTRGLGL